MVVYLLYTKINARRGFEKLGIWGKTPGLDGGEAGVGWMGAGGQKKGGELIPLPVWLHNYYLQFS
jgi:hypothetical protein